MRCKFQWLVNINEKNSGLTVIECVEWWMRQMKC